jgi:hypothetical protein
MTMTADIGHTRPARSPDTKAAINYLIASGATAISIVEIDGVCAFHVGHKIDPHAVSVQWLPETHARAIVKQARRDAGRNPNAVTAARALAQAAADHRTTLTPNDVANSRARDASRKIEQYMQSLRGTGALKEFNRAYKQHRMAATARGEGFMSYATATARLRRALIPLLVNGRTVGPAQSLFAEIFDR